MAKIGRISTGKPAWQNFDPSKAKLTKNQKEALKRTELRAICDEIVKKDKFKYAFYEVNRSYLGENAGRHVFNSPNVRAVSRFTAQA